LQENAITLTSLNVSSTSTPRFEIASIINACVRERKREREGGRERECVIERERECVRKCVGLVFASVACRWGCCLYVGVWLGRDTECAGHELRRREVERQ